MDSDVEEGEIPDELNPGAEPACGERAAPEHSNAVRGAVNLVHACTTTQERCHHTLSCTLAETACSTCAVLKQVTRDLAGRQPWLTCSVPSCFVYKCMSLRVQPAVRAARCLCQAGAGPGAAGPGQRCVNQRQGRGRAGRRPRARAARALCSPCAGRLGSVAPPPVSP